MWRTGESGFDLLGIADDLQERENEGGEGIVVAGEEISF